MSKIRFRPCRPSDFPQAVPLIYSSGPDAFNFVFKNQKDTAMDFLNFAFQRPAGEFSYDNHIALTVDEEVLGVGAHFSGSKAFGFTFHDAIKIMKFYRFDSPGVMIRGLKIEQIIKLPKKKEVCIAHLGVKVSERSKGYGKALIEELMLRANIDNQSKFVLDVSEENQRARFLYERLGFQVKKSIMSELTSDYGKVVNHLRMEKVPKS